MTELFPASCRIYSLDGSEIKPSQSPQLDFSGPAGGMEKRIALQGVQRKLCCVEAPIAISLWEHLMGADISQPYPKG